MPDRPPSLQDVLKRRQASSFVGRAGEIRQFEENLRLGADDVRRTFLFSLHGTAGVGKTTLLKQLVRIAADQDHVTGFVDEVAYDIPSSLQLLTDDLESQSVRLRRLRKRLGTYQQRRIELDSDPGAPSPLTKSAVGIAMAVAKEVPIARSVAGAVDTNTVASEVDRYQKYLRRKFRNPDDVQLLLSPDKLLTQAFLADLREIAKTQPVALFFDTFEYTGTFLEPWLLDLLAGRFGAAPPNIVLTIAGQHPLALNRWGDYLIARADLPLAEFTEDEARTLLAVRGVTNDDVVETILDRSGALPLLVASYSEGKPEQVADLGDPTNDVIERFLKWETEPKRRTAALLGALPRSLNRDIFAIIADSSAVDEEYARLRLLPFVKEHTDGLSYHELARNAMLRHIRGTSPAQWQRRHLALADHFQLMRDGLELEDAAAWRNERWQLFAMEEQYHRLCANASNSLGSTLAGLATANIWRPGMSARWARMIHQAGIDADDAPVTKRGDRLATWAESGTQDDRLRIAADLAEDTALDSPARALAYMDRGYIRATRNEFDPALADLNRAAELWPGRDNIIARRGEAYRRAGRFTEALADFNQALTIRPDYEWALASRAQTYVALQQPDNALVDLNRAIDLDPKYIWAIVKRGIFYHRLDRYQDALTEFNRAIEIDPEDSRVLADRARTYAAMQRIDEALADLAHAIEIDPEYTWAIGKRGIVYYELNRQQDALTDYNRAIEINPQDPWLLVHRARTYRALGMLEDALADLDRAIEIDPEYYLARVQRAELHRTSGSHESALADLEKSLELNPTAGWAHYQMALTLPAMGRSAEAVERLSRAVEVDRANTLPISADTYRRFTVAVYLLALDRPDEAQAQLHATLTGPVSPIHIRNAIDDFEELHQATGRAVEPCVEILRAALP